MILPAMLAGATVGAGLLVAARGLHRTATAQTRTPPGRALRATSARSPGQSVLHAAGRRGPSSWSPATGSDLVALRRDLAVSGMTIERHAVAKLTFAVAGAGLPARGRARLERRRHRRAHRCDRPDGARSPGLPASSCPTCCSPDGPHNADADFRYALSLFLDLVVIVLAGGGGVETALYDAANAGSGWAFGELRRALNAARLQRTLTVGRAQPARRGPRVGRAHRAGVVGRARRHVRRPRPRVAAGQGHQRPRPRTRRGRGRSARRLRADGRPDGRACSSA